MIDSLLNFILEKKYLSNPSEIRNIRKCLENIVQFNPKDQMKFSKPISNSYVKFDKNKSLKASLQNEQGIETPS